MTLGFFCWGVLGLIQIVFTLLVVLYGVFNAFGEMGPGVATFLCASESFPKPLRGHYLGLAAAVGKAGAAIGTQVFTPIQDSFSDTLKGQQRVFWLRGRLRLWERIVDLVFVPQYGEGDGD